MLGEGRVKWIKKYEIDLPNSQDNFQMQTALAATIVPAKPISTPIQFK